MSGPGDRPAAVLFDLDGTLADTAADLCASANAMRDEHGLPPIPLAQFRPWVSRGGRAMLDLAFAHMDDEARAQLLAPFLARYAESPCVHTRLFPGLGALLDRFEALGMRWGIVTNKPFHLAEPVVAGLGLAARCGVLIGGDSLPAKKPDPMQLNVACARLDVAAASCIYVGDDRRDVMAARAAGMTAVAVRWGYLAPDDPIESWGADHLVDSAQSLAAVCGL